MTSTEHAWPEPVTRVQQLSDSGIRVIPDRYVKEPVDLPGATTSDGPDIPVVDMEGLSSGDAEVRRRTATLIDEACREWGFFQVANHGVSPDLMARCREAWREFFQLPLAEKQRYANSPATYEGYGSRLGLEKGVSLDWNDYFFLYFLPIGVKDKNKWPTLPVGIRSH
ncbi:hypothetical protein SASPL_105385 [Salvia splendens]|uniref:Non-haem dioxygenase N-terminal domain-containing protein n=1 Tax=Salvia splendens TaxID=180675 RepID=A0A8X9A9X9_SALSN|nr:hypothetical protein SASPL_105385 [Salvia splendens]